MRRMTSVHSTTVLRSIVARSNTSARAIAALADRASPGAYPMMCARPATANSGATVGRRQYVY
jgi:hypothetical protein